MTAWGTLKGEEFTPKGMARPVAYQVLHLERLHGPTFDLPRPIATPEPSGPPEPSEAEPPDDVALLGESPGQLEALLEVT